MNSEQRRIRESPLFQGVDESIAYALDVTPWGAGPSSVVFVIKDDNGSNVTSIYSTGSPSVSGNVITWPAIHSLGVNTHYRVEVKFTVSGNVFEAWADLYGEL